MARLDVTAANENEWQSEERVKVFTDMKRALHSWIYDKNVIGASVFGRSVSDTESCTKELEVH